MQVLEQGNVDSIHRLTQLHIIDFGRRNGAPFGSTLQAIEAVSIYAHVSFSYTVIQDDMTAYPDAAGWLGWHHAGNHEQHGRLLWNMIQSRFPGSTLTFTDKPDFAGTLHIDTPTAQEDLHLVGDIGQVSAMGFMEGVKTLHPGDMWMTIYDPTTYIILEASLEHALIVHLYQRALNAILVGEPFDWDAAITAEGYHKEDSDDAKLDWAEKTGLMTAHRVAMTRKRQSIIRQRLSQD